MESLMSKIIAIAVGLLMVAVLVPIALTTLASANVTGVDPVVVTVLTVLLPILAIIGIALLHQWPTHYAAKFHSEDEVGSGNNDRNLAAGVVSGQTPNPSFSFL